jgi:hypothetical protein
MTPVYFQWHSVSIVNGGKAPEVQYSTLKNETLVNFQPGSKYFFTPDKNRSMTYQITSNGKQSRTYMLFQSLVQLHLFFNYVLTKWFLFFNHDNIIHCTLFPYIFDRHTRVKIVFCNDGLLYITLWNTKESISLLKYSCFDMLKQSEINSKWSLLFFDQVFTREKNGHFDTCSTGNNVLSCPFFSRCFFHNKINSFL